MAGTLMLSTAANGAIYTFVDTNGTVHFTNVPSDPRFRPGLKRGITHRPIRPGNPAHYEDYIRRAARLYEVDPLLVKAVIKAESNFDYQAVSRRGAQGLMQLMPDTAADLNICDPFDPQANILGGTCYLRQMLGRFKGNVKLALAAYNAGPTLVENLGRMPRITETRRYVLTVLNHYRNMTRTSSPYKRWVKVVY
jgi:soluble lytic murein transglycosylase